MMIYLSKIITIDLCKVGSYEIYRVDNHHNGELTEITDNLSFEIGLFGMVLIREKFFFKKLKKVVDNLKTGEYNADNN